MKRILLIDDDSFILQLLTDLLKVFRYDAEQVKSGRTALEKLDHEEYDAIFLDVHLKDLDGEVIYQEIKERFPNLADRIVIMTGDHADPRIASFIKQTGNPCLEKPFTITQLDELLKLLFQREVQ